METEMKIRMETEKSLKLQDEKRDRFYAMSRNCRIAQGVLLLLLGCTASNVFLEKVCADTNDGKPALNVLSRLRPSFMKPASENTDNQMVPDAFIHPNASAAPTASPAGTAVSSGNSDGWSNIGTAYATPSSGIQPEAGSRYILPSPRGNAYAPSTQNAQQYGTQYTAPQLPQLSLPPVKQAPGSYQVQSSAQPQSSAKVQLPDQGQTAVQNSHPVQGALPELFPLDKRVFDLPFDTLIGHIPENQLKEVRFYVSRDNGNTWRYYHSLSREKIQASPDKSLRVKTESDGEFWFTVRAVNLQNQEITGTSGIPDWRILVNTTGKPMNTLMNQVPAGTGTGGTGISAAGNAAGNIAGNGPLQYQAALPAAQTHTGAKRPQWSPDPNEQTVSSPASAPNGPLSAAHAQIPQSNTVLYSVMDKGQYSIQNRSLPVFRIQSKQSAEQFIQRLLNENDHSHSASKPVPGEMQETNHSSELSVPELETDPRTDTGSEGTASLDTSPLEDGSLDPELTGQLDAELETESSENAVFDAAETEAGSSRHSDSESDEEQDLLMIDDTEFVEETAGNKIRYVNQPALDIDYDISTVGTSGVGRVELWATTDNGQTWTKMAEDEDCTSPLRVNLTTDGKYGFQILLFNGAGVGMERPESGSLPQLEVVLDRVSPQVQLHTIQLQAEFGDLEIQWSAEDQNFSSQPLLFSWSSAKDGPWRPMSTSRLENTGRYTWRIPEKVPGSVFIRADFFDQAQNSATLITGPVVTDVVRPTGVILDVKPQN